MFFDQISVIWAGKIHYSPGHSTERHTHDFFQLLYVTDGSGCMYTSQETYIIKSNHLFFCPPGYSHRITSDKHNPLRTIEFKFDINQKEMLDRFQNISGSIKFKSVELQSCLENIMSEAVKKEVLFKDIINLKFTIALLNILQMVDDEQQNTVCDKPQNTSSSDQCIKYIQNSSMNNAVFTRIFNYIESNLSIPISLDDLARQVGLESSYLCRIFRRKFGITPIRYINDLKISKAKKLLAGSELNVTQVAESLGFCSVHYFSRFFKERVKICPIQYKNMVANNILIKLDDKYEDVDGKWL